MVRRRMPGRVAPLAFLMGLGAGLLTLSWLGATVQSSYLVQNFVRFHQYISLGGGFFPTARQVRSILDARTDQPHQIFVIIGGSSVFYGVGQNKSLIWTRFLQEQLGPEFH